MSRYTINHNSKKCIACFSCEVGCKATKNLSIGPRLCRVLELDPKASDDQMNDLNHYIGCYHCDAPSCVAVCPTGAMQKRASDGIVLLDSSKCVNCRMCISTCPYGAVQWDSENKEPVKCDLCYERIDDGLKPACVTLCTTQCLSLESNINYQP